MPTFIGLDVGKYSIKAAVVDGSAKSPRVRDFFVTPRPDEVPGETESEQLEFLIREFFLEHRGLSHGNVIIALGEGSTVVRSFTVEFTKDEQIRETIRFNAEPHFHLLTMEEVILQYRKVGIEEGRSRIYAAVAKKRDLRETLDVMQKAGIDPVMLDLNLAAIANAVQPCLPGNGSPAAGLPEQDGDESLPEPDPSGENGDPFSLVMDLGASAVRFIIFRRSNFFGTRVFQTRVPSGADSEIAYTKKVALEVKRTMATLPPGHPLERIMITGGISLRESILPLLREELDVPAEKLDLASAFRMALDEDRSAELNALGAVAIGLAAKGLGKDLLGFDYRCGPFQYVKKFDKIKKGLACTACLLFVIVFLWTYATQLKLGMRRNEKRVAGQKLTDIFKTLLPGDEKNWKGKTAKSFRTVVEKRRTGETIGFPTTVSALEYLNMFSQCLYEAKRQWTWESGIFSENGCSIKGRATSDQSATYIKQILDRSGKKHFARTDMSARLDPTSGEYRIDFRLTTTKQK
ncbi:MAG: type IV pilus biogenesis protein PilM [Planctomycetota bacterium]|jgi:Tfp pilus assembly PilM family ATPase